MKSVTMATGSFILIYAGMCLYLYFNQRNMIYFPVRGDQPVGLERVVLNANGVSLNAWVLNPGRRQAILYFGGNAEAVAYNAASFSDWFGNYTVYLTEYRGYGNSTGSPTEQGLYADALAWYDHASSRHERIAVLGRSLGTAVAIHLAGNRTVTHMGLVSPFDSVINLARHHYPLFPVTLLLKEHYNSLAHAQQLRMPILMIAAANDRIIPLERTRKLLGAISSNQASLVTIRHAGHNDLSLKSEYAKALADFFSHQSTSAIASAAKQSTNFLKHKEHDR